MRKNVFGRQFKRDTNERKHLFRSLLNSLILHERIETTEAKAKAIKGAADKLITKAKKTEVVAYRNLQPLVNHASVVKLITDLAPRFADRQGGYTRILKTKRRLNDNAELAIIEWTEKSTKLKIKSEKLDEDESDKDSKEAAIKVSEKKKAKKEEKKEAKAAKKTVKKKETEKKEVKKEKKK